MDLPAVGNELAIKSEAIGPDPQPDQQPTAGTVSAGAPDQKGPYPPPALLPTQEGPKGLRFDFNLGARVTIPEGRPWRVRLRDLDTGNILFESSPGASFITSTKRYFLRFAIEVFDERDRIFHHQYDAEDKKVLVQFPVGTLGDTMGWFPYAVKFQERHGCALTCAMSGLLIPLFKDAYPEICFIVPEEVKPEEYYATYCIGLFFDDEERIWQPCDFRLVGLHRTAGYILGVDPTEVPPKLAMTGDGPPISEPYVCIAAQSTTQSKYWNNPNGWRQVVDFLKQRGYRVICIDQKPVHGGGIVWNHIPYGAEDQTGDRPLSERVRWLRHAKAFIGLSSGLSWLAWATGVPIVMISGFTHPTNEFATPYRVINYHACNSCWNDVRLRFDHKDFLWCPRHKDTPRQFECTRLITAEQVIATVTRIPGFAAEAKPPRKKQCNESQDAKLVWCLGLYGSASTWLYNVARLSAECAGQGEVKTHFFAGQADPSDYDRPGFVNIVKTHEISDEATILELGRRSSRIIVSVRDPRDAVTSLMLYHDYEFEHALQYVTSAMHLCARFANDQRTLLFQYETSFFDDATTIKRVAGHLGFQLSEDEQEKVFAATRRPVIESFIANLATVPGTLQDRISGDRLDPKTHWHTHHAGRNGEIGRWKRILTPSQDHEVMQRMHGIDRSLCDFQNTTSVA